MIGYPRHPLRVTLAEYRAAREARRWQPVLKAGLALAIGAAAALWLLWP